MIYTDKKQLTNELKKITIDEDISYKELAEKLELSPQAFNKLLNKKNLCFDDFKRILEPLNYQLEISFKKVDD